MSGIIDPNSLAPVTVGYTPFPNDGPRSLAVPLNFANAASYLVDLTSLEQRAYISAVQSLYVDNSANANTLTITVNQAGQSLIVPAGAQGYFPVLVPNPSRFTFASAGTALVYVFLLNIPVTCQIWFPNSVAPNFTSGKLQVTDPILDAAITANVLQVTAQPVYSDSVLHPELRANKIVNGNLTATGLSAALITGNPGYFLQAFQLDVSSDATLAVAGPLLVTIEDSSTGIIAQAIFYVPAAAATSTQTKQNPANYFWNNKVINTTLAIRLSAALTAGKLYYTLNYGIANFVG